MAKVVKTVTATEVQPVKAVADAAEAAAEAAKTAPWRCVTCWKAGKDNQLADKEQSDPTGRLKCPDCGTSWWGKSGLDG